MRAVLFFVFSFAICAVAVADRDSLVGHTIIEVTSDTVFVFNSDGSPTEKEIGKESLTGRLVIDQKLAFLVKVNSRAGNVWVDLSNLKTTKGTRPDCIVADSTKPRDGMPLNPRGSDECAKSNEN